MTLDEAIKHEEEEAKEQDKLCKRSDDASGYTRSHIEDIRTSYAKKCERCAEEHRQLAEWLKDYKRLLEQEPCGDAIDRAEAIRIASGYCHPANVAKELAKLPPVNPQPCEDAISRQAALGCCRNEWEEEVEIRLKSLPSVNPTKTGHWIAENSVLRCSECNEGVARYDNYAYCPYCGARMVEPQERSDKE